MAVKKRRSITISWFLEVFWRRMKYLSTREDLMMLKMNLMNSMLMDQELKILLTTKQLLAGSSRDHYCPPKLSARTSWRINIEVSKYKRGQITWCKRREKSSFSKLLEIMKKLHKYQVLPPKLPIFKKKLWKLEVKKTLNLLQVWIKVSKCKIETWFLEMKSLQQLEQGLRWVVPLTTTRSKR